jgi:hypothetical protein
MIFSNFVFLSISSQVAPELAELRVSGCSRQTSHRGGIVLFVFRRSGRLSHDFLKSRRSPDTFPDGIEA